MLKKLWVLVLLCLPTGALSYQVTRMAEGVDVPWSLAFLPFGEFLVTERSGQLWHFQPNGARKKVSGLPEIPQVGQGGLLDVVVSRDFKQNGLIFLSYIEGSSSRGYRPVLSVAEFDAETSAIGALLTVFRMSDTLKSGQHFGGRIVEGLDDTLFLTIGDRGFRDSAQDLATHAGKIIRVNLDGSVPRDNPFYRYARGKPEIWSLGHRNPQGATLAPDGALWVSEHGPRGGDEINQVEPGNNYGWPVIGYGTHYDGSKVGRGTHRRGMEQPALYWDPSIAPSGLAFYDGTLFPDWQSDMLVGSLKFDYIARLSGEPLQEVEQIKLPQTGRVRDVRVAPDGSVWFLSEDDSAVYRLSP